MPPPEKTTARIWKKKSRLSRGSGESYFEIKTTASSRSCLKYLPDQACPFFHNSIYSPHRVSLKMDKNSSPSVACHQSPGTMGGSKSPPLFCTIFINFLKTKNSRRNKKKTHAEKKKRRRGKTETPCLFTTPGSLSPPPPSSTPWRLI